MRLINADDIATQLRQRSQTLKGTYGDLGGACSGVARLIEEAPTVDAIPVFVIEQIIMMSKAHDDSLVQLSASPLVALLKTWKEITEDKTNE